MPATLSDVAIKAYKTFERTSRLSNINLIVTSAQFSLIILPNYVIIIKDLNKLPYSLKNLAKVRSPS
jgi:hypothetical protein